MPLPATSVQPCWHSISAGATDVSNLTTRTKAAGGDSDLNIIALSFEDLKAGFPLLVKVLFEVSDTSLLCCRCGLCMNGGRTISARSLLL